MNVILFYTQIKEFDEPTLEKISKLQFSRIPEMRVIDNIMDDEIVSKSRPYQADVLDQEELDYLESMLGYFGTVDIIGKWNDDGSKIELDINKYRDALNNVKEFEKATIIDGVDYTGIEDSYTNPFLLDENGDEVLDSNGDNVIYSPSVRTFTRVKSSKRPTLEQAKLTQVNVFNNKFKRELWL